jgi:hypothetical protein
MLCTFHFLKLMFMLSGVYNQRWRSELLLNWVRLSAEVEVNAIRMTDFALKPHSLRGKLNGIAVYSPENNIIAAYLNLPPTCQTI